MSVLKIVLKIAGGLFLFPVVMVGALCVYWDVRPAATYEFDPVLQYDNWVATPAGDDAAKEHSSNTELIYFKDNFYLVHAQTMWHLEDKKGSLVIKRSPDAKNWEEVERLTIENTDVRDPKCSVIHGKLFCYFLPNKNFDPDPRTTYWTVSEDGDNWTEPKELDTVTTMQYIDDVRQPVTTAGWMLWRPKTIDNVNWYVVAFGRKAMSENFGVRNQMSVLLKTQDGINFEEVSEVYNTHGTCEPTLEFRTNGDIISTLRCSSLGAPGYLMGNPTANTIIATAKPPYTEWSHAHSFITRLDGATLFPIGDRIFAVGRNHMGPRIDLGNHFTPKRTTFYEVEKDKMTFLFDVESTGDTTYSGVVVRGDDVYASYYTSPIDKEYPWIFAICYKTKTEVRIAKVSAEGLVAYADKVKREARLEGHGLYRAGKEQEEE